MKKIKIAVSLFLLCAVLCSCEPTEWERNSELYGSADTPYGRTIVYTVFLNDPAYSWDTDSAEDAERMENIYEYLGIACDYLEAESRKYGSDLSFIYGKADTSSAFTVTIECDSEGWDDALWRLIDENVDSAAISEKYRARNIIYLFCVNTDENNEAITSTRSWYEDMPYPYEFISLYYVDSGFINCPAVYAHEILHTFGAPDLYMEDYGEYGITEAFVNWVADNLPNDIMFNCSDEVTGEYLYDGITNEISEVTAYYVGWLNESDIISEMGLKSSERGNQP